MQEGKLVSAKQLSIDKANSMIVIVLSVCSFIFVFSLVAAKTLVSQYSYQSRVTSALQKTVNQLKADQTAATQLINSYNSFNNQASNIIGGSSTGTSSNQDGSNSKIILDALPDSYDYPATITSFGNLLDVQSVTTSGFTITQGSGSTASSTPAPTSPSAATSSSTSAKSSTPPVAIPFAFSITGSFSADNSFLTRLQESIKPMQLSTINVTGSDSSATMAVTGETYYLPAAGLQFSSEVVK
jgi:hypothetical protein